MTTTYKKEVVKKCILKCTRCSGEFKSNEIRVELLTIGMLITVCPLCGTTFTVSQFPTEYITYVDEQGGML